MDEKVNEMSRIKEELKKIGITLSEFANSLGISRPTLDSYIHLYEANKKIPKEPYQKIFEEIFYNKVQNRNEIFNIIDKSIIAVTTISEDVVNCEVAAECDSNNIDKIINSISKEIKDDLDEETYDEDIYLFIRMIIKSYKKEKAFKKLAKYFLVLNGKYDLNNDLEEQTYISNYFKLFYCDKYDLLKIDEEYLEKFRMRRNEILQKQQKQKDKLKEDIMKKFMDKVEEFTSLGIDIEDIDMKQILNEIK